MGAFYCDICRQTDFSGKAHIYGKGHQSKLKVVLVKFTEKVKEARRTIKTPQVEKFDYSQHRDKFWCYCCKLEVPKHVTNDNLTVLFGGLLEHMSTREHRTNTHKFWWDNKADPKLRDRFLVTEEETERFKIEVAKALEEYEEKEDVLIKEQAAIIRSQEQHRQKVLQALLEVCFSRMQQHQPDPELEHATEQNCLNGEPTASTVTFHGSEDQPGPSTEDQILNSHWMEPELGLTFIGYQDSSSSGNVHTGGVPPWLQANEEQGDAGSQKEIGPSLNDFLRHKEQEKLKKLPPNRVGANFDHSSQTDAGWLPSFGRVWNSGRRWQSRQQYRAEEAATSSSKRKQNWGGKASKKQKHSRNGDIPH